MDRDTAATVEAIRQLASAITPRDAAPYKDDIGNVSSLTEAVIMVGERLDRLARAAGDIAEAIRDRG